MISRYTLPEMGKVWSEQNRFEQMLQVEIYACEAMKDMGELDAETYEEIKDTAGFDLQRIKEIEDLVKHDVVAFLMAVSEKIGEKNAQKIHFGMTSSDILDTALSVQMKQASELIIGKLYTLRDVLVGLAKKYKYNLIVGRTHGIHAEPMTYGIKMALWVTDIDRCIVRMNNARNNIAVGKISGNVGTYATVDPFVEEHVCRRLELRPAPVSTQCLQRDRHAYFVENLALVGCILDKFATEVRNLERTEIGELSEPYIKSQRGSSAMPHKLNPVRPERITGLARMLRSYVSAVLEDVPLWHERDMTHSSVERIIIPDSCILLDYMLYMMTETMKRTVVNTEIMLDNLDMTKGLIFSQSVLMSLVEKGVPRDNAFEMVQKVAGEAYDEYADFQYFLMEDETIMQYFTPAELDEIFDYDRYLKHIDYIYHRAGIE
ncbi:MAG: adenylosuccinate lyase [Bacillota bacterium]|jgi:adenylosuccinate lyase